MAANGSFAAPLAPVKGTNAMGKLRLLCPEEVEISSKLVFPPPRPTLPSHWSSSGAAGSRTPVQASSKYAFYTLSLLLIVGKGTGLRPAHAFRIPLSFAPASGPCSDYSGFFDASDGAPPIRAPRETAGGAKLAA